MRGINPLEIAKIRIAIKALPSVDLMLNNGQTIIYQIGNRAYKVERIAKTGIFSIDYHITQIKTEGGKSKYKQISPIFYDDVAAITKPDYIGEPLEEIGKFDLESYKEIKKTIVGIERLLMGGFITVYDLAINTDLATAEINSFLEGKNILSKTYYALSNYLKRGQDV